MANTRVGSHPSYGGTVVVNSYFDSRIDACLSLDGWFEPIPPNIINEGIQIPFCYIGQLQEQWGEDLINGSQLMKFHNNTQESYIIEIKETKHFDYADIPYISRISRIMGMSGKAGKHLTKDLNRAITFFFDTYLKNDKKDWFDILESNYNINSTLKYTININK